MFKLKEKDEMLTKLWLNKEESKERENNEN